MQLQVEAANDNKLNDRNTHLLVSGPMVFIAEANFPLILAWNVWIEHANVATSYISEY